MAQFDFASGVQGAGTGAQVGGPYGALAGFVIGGFAGGSAKRRAEKRKRKLQKKMERLASPEYLAKVTQKLTPAFREQVAGSAGPAIQSATATQLGQSGLENTGIGMAMKSAAAGAPETLAFNAAQGQARGVIANQMAALTGREPREATDVAGMFASASDMIDYYRKLNKNPKAGPEGGLQLLSGPGQESVLGESTGSFAEQFGQFGDNDPFSRFAPGR